MLESVASSLAVNEEIGDEESVTVLDFKDNMSAIVVERVNMLLYFKKTAYQNLFSPLRVILICSSKKEKDCLLQEEVKV